MKTLNWQAVKKISSLLMLTLALASTVACSKKSSKSEVSSRYRNGGGAWNENYNQIDPSTGQYFSAGWGAIYNFSANNLREFMINSDLANISSRKDDTTGVRFRGTARQGSTIYILVWDQISNQTGEAFYWGMRVTSVQGGPQQGGATVIAEDELGSIIFDGDIRSGYWSGTVTFQNNNDGQSLSLGSFEINQQDIGF